MQRVNKPSIQSASIDMTPMLDIVFIMLIFFIVTATFLDEQGVALTALPQETAAPNRVKSVMISIDKDDNCAVSGVSTPCDQAALAVETLRAQSVIAGALLRVDERARHKTVIAVHDATMPWGLLACQALSTL